jgi:hypothetical protein
MDEEHERAEESEDLGYAEDPYEEEAGAQSIDFWTETASKDWK